MQSKDYWAMRALQREQEGYDSTIDMLNRLHVIYDAAAARLVKVAKNIFKNYMQASGVVDEQTARQLLTPSETADILEKLRTEYASTGSIDTLAKLNAPAYGYRISRVQALRQAIDTEARQISAQEGKAGATQLAKVYDDAYYKTIYDRATEPEGISISETKKPAQSKPREAQNKQSQKIPEVPPKIIQPDFVPLAPRSITEAVENRWKGENYSERVWKNTQLVAQEAGKIIDAGLASGASIQQMSHDIMNIFDVGYYAASRLVRTEMNRMHNDATLKAYKDMGTEEYEFLATLDARTCSVCGALDGKRFKVADAKTGTNLPPIHPNDRCTTLAVIPDMKDTGMRTARDPTTGRNYKVPAGTTYSEWRKQIDKQYGAGTLDDARKMLISHHPDEEQLKRLQTTLGKDAPKDLATFRELKYNNAEKWKRTLLDYRRRNRLLTHPELALPNAENTVIEDSKFTKYLFGGDNPDGLSKGDAFRSHLGYNENNWKDFRNEILQASKRNPSAFDRETEHGKYYNQRMIVYGPKKNPMDITVPWEIKDGKARMVTAFPN